jgi:hypothetical protein
VGTSKNEVERLSSGEMATIGGGNCQWATWLRRAGGQPTPLCLSLRPGCEVVKAWRAHLIRPFGERTIRWSVERLAMSGRGLKYGPHPPHQCFGGGLGASKNSRCTCSESQNRCSAELSSTTVQESTLLKASHRPGRGVIMAF